MSISIRGARGLQADFERFMQQVSQTTQGVADKVARAIGEMFNALAALKDDANGLGFALEGIKRTGLAASKLKGRAVLPTAFAGRLDSAIQVIDVTRSFSDLYYIVSGEWLDDFRAQKFSGIFGKMAFSVTNGINAFLGIKDMAKISATTGQKEALGKIGDAFAIGGFMGYIGDSIQRLIASKGKEPDAWLDLLSCIVGISLPILGFAGVTHAPLLLSLALLSSALGVAGVICSHYFKKKESAAALDFAERTEGLGKTLTPVSSLGGLLSKITKSPTLDSLLSISSDIKSLTGFSAALAIISRGKDWFYPDRQGKYGWQRFTNWNQAKGEYEWMRFAGWKIAKQAAATVQNGMEFYKFLVDTSLINQPHVISASIGRIPIFNTVKDLVGVTAFGCSLVNNGLELAENKKEQSHRLPKQEQWQILTSVIQAEASPEAEAAWLKQKERLSAHYNIKRLQAGARGSFSAADDERWENYKRNIENGSLLGFFEAKKAYRIQKLTHKLSATADAHKRRAIQAKIGAFESGRGVDYAQYKHDKLTWRVNKLEVEHAKLSWGAAQDAFKVALPLITLVGLLTAVASTLPFAIAVAALSLVSASIGFGKYMVDSSLKVEAKPLPIIRVPLSVMAPVA